MIEKLTKEQKARFPEFVDKWKKIGLSTEPANRPEAEKAIDLLEALEKSNYYLCCLEREYEGDFFKQITNNRYARNQAKTIKKPIDFFKPARYKVFYGVKSYNIAQALLFIGFQKQTQILCIRETKESIEPSTRKSLHKSLSTIINKNPLLVNHYEILQNEIRGKNGTVFIFDSLTLNEEAIKSIGGVNIALVEETIKLSKKSLKTLNSIVREPNSEIWFMRLKEKT